MAEAALTSWVEQRDANVSDSATVITGVHIPSTELAFSPYFAGLNQMGEV